jgi:acyl carrier protein
MTVEKIKETVRAFLSQFISGTYIDNDQDLFQSGLLNSLFAMQLIIFLEKEYGFLISNEDLDLINFKSLNAISTFVMNKKS